MKQALMKQALMKQNSLLFGQNIQNIQFNCTNGKKTDNDISVLNIRINKIIEFCKTCRERRVRSNYNNAKRWLVSKTAIKKRLQAPQLESDYGKCGTHERVHSLTPSHGKSEIEIGQHRKNAAVLNPTPVTRNRPSSLNIGYGECVVRERVFSRTPSHGKSENRL